MLDGPLFSILEVEGNGNLKLFPVHRSVLSRAIIDHEAGKVFWFHVRWGPWKNGNERNFPESENAIEDCDLVRFGYTFRFHVLRVRPFVDSELEKQRSVT